MNQLRYISTVSSAVHESIEGWARARLREAGIETTEVYGQFPPEGTIASHVVLFPYRLSAGDTNLTTASQNINMLGRRGTLPPGAPVVWGDIAHLITRAVLELYPQMTRGPRAGQPHPAPEVKLLPKPLAKWYKEQGDSKTETSWVTRMGRTPHARLPSLAWRTGVNLRFQYLIVVGEGARGTTETDAPVAVQSLSVLAASAQLHREVWVNVPAIPVTDELISFVSAAASCFDSDPEVDAVVSALPHLRESLEIPVTLLPGAALSNGDFTGLMQALQRPLQPTIHLAVQMSMGGAPVFEPGINAAVSSEQKSRRVDGRS